MKVSAGILPWRRRAELEVLLVHPGGPLWAKKDEGAWSIAKGLVEEGESPEAAARREFVEETGWALPAALAPLGEITQRGGKRVIAFAAEMDLDPATLVSGTFEMEWPPRSGRRAAFPEVDRAAWFAPDAARRAINPAQAELIERLAAQLR